MLEFRRATSADLASICALGTEVNALHVQAWPQIFRASGEPDRDSSFWDAYLHKEDSIIVLAERDSAVVGMATAQVATESASLLVPVTYCRVGSVCVVAAERGKGVGRQLMTRIEAWASELGAVDVRLNVWQFNSQAVAFYEELGYAVRSHFMGKFL